MYIEASSPRSKGDIAYLVSEEFSATSSSGRCIKFWYHMFGNSIGSLKVYYQSNATGVRQPIWELTGRQSSSHNDWKFAQAPIRSKTLYQVCVNVLHMPCSGWSIGRDVTEVHFYKHYALISELSLSLYIYGTLAPSHKSRKK